MRAGNLQQSRVLSPASNEQSAIESILLWRPLNPWALVRSASTMLFKELGSSGMKVSIVCLGELEICSGEHRLICAPAHVRRMSTNRGGIDLGSGVSAGSAKRCSEWEGFSRNAAPGKPA